MATLISQEPLFYGDFPYRRGTSAEDFIARVTNWATANGWDAAAKTAQALNFLRDDAAHYFKHVLQVKSMADYDLIHNGNWEAFERVFTATYFSVRTTFDLSADWTKLKQGPQEKAFLFAGRVGGLLIQYCNLLPEAPLTNAEWADFRATLNPAIGAAAATNEQVQAIRDWLTLKWQSRRKEQQRIAYLDLGYKILASGMSNKTLIAKVRAKERALAPFGEIIDFLEQEEANMTQTPAPADNKHVKSTLPGTISEVFADDDPDTSHERYLEEVAALNSRFGKGQGKGKGTGKGKGKGKAKPQQQHQQQAKPSGGSSNPAPKQYVKDYSKPGFGLPCKHCKQTGHWQNECPSAPSSSNQHVVSSTAAQGPSHNLPVDIRYQQFLAMEAQQFGGSVNSVQAAFTGPAYDAMWSKNANAEG